MGAVFVALEPGWMSVYHDKEKDEVWAEACPGVVSWEEQTVDDKYGIAISKSTRMGYASFNSKGGWNIASASPWYVMTTFVGPGQNITREEYDEIIVKQTMGNRWKIQ